MNKVINIAEYKIRKSEYSENLHWLICFQDLQKAMNDVHRRAKLTCVK